MSGISKEEIRHLAHLAKISTNDEEIEMFAQYIDQMNLVMKQLNEINTEEIIPMTHGMEFTNIMREDVATHTLDREKAFLNSPAHETGQIKVPSILGGNDK